MTEIAGGECDSAEALNEAAEAAAILGTLQAGYTNFGFLDSATREITEREALIGVSITGWMSQPHVLFDENNMRVAARLVVETNKKVAALLGINAAARCTTVKPSGNASVLLGCSSGIHGDHAPRYFRNMQMNKDKEVTQLIMETNPRMWEESLWSKNKTDVVVSFPVVAEEGSIFKRDLFGVKQLDYVKKVQQVWIEEGKDVSLCVHPKLSHNVSNTISVDNWDEVEEYIYENRHYFAGISLLGASGDKDFAQAPFTEVFTAEQILEKYGMSAMFASGLIVDGLHAFHDNLWLACDTALGYGMKLTQYSQDLYRRDWVRRAHKFAENYFNGDMVRMTHCLKDVHNLHRWEGITRGLKQIDFASELKQEVYTEVDTMGAIACSGGVCEFVGAPEVPNT